MAHTLSPVDRMRLHRGAAHVHGLGVRAIGEVFVELASGPLGSAPVLAVLDGCAHLTPDMVAAAGGARPFVVRLLSVP